MEDHNPHNSGCGSEGGWGRNLEPEEDASKKKEVVHKNPKSLNEALFSNVPPPPTC